MIKPVARFQAWFTAAPPPVRGGVLALLAAAAFSWMAVLIKLSAEELHPLQIVFFRNLIAVMLMVPWLMKNGLGAMRTKRIGMYTARGLVSWVAMTSGFTAVTMIPITMATALSFTSPIFATIGAALILGEVVRLRRWTAVIIGFLGAMIVLRPGVDAIELGAIFALVNAVGMATNKLMLKSLVRTERSEAIILYMVVFLTPLSFIPALFVWQWPTLETFALLVLLAGAGTLGHWFLTRAFGAADLTVVLPFDFARLPFAAVIAFLVFAEIPTVWTFIGGGVIFASTFYIARREAQISRARRAEMDGAKAAASPPAPDGQTGGDDKPSG